MFQKFRDFQGAFSSSVPNVSGCWLKSPGSWTELLVTVLGNPTGACFLVTPNKKKKKGNKKVERLGIGPPITLRYFSAKTRICSSKI